MNIAVISAFDHAFMHYAVRMYNSVKAFHPHLPLYAGDLGLTAPDIRQLHDMGVKVVFSPKVKTLKEHGLRLCFGDFLLRSFLKDEGSIDQYLWIDADTMVLREFELPMYFPGMAGVVGHPGRCGIGPILTMAERYRIAPGTTHREHIEKCIGWNDGPYIATGLWMTNDLGFLGALEDEIDKMYGLTDDSPIFSAIMNARGVLCHHLDSARWNFSRDLVGLARYIDGQIVYGHPAERIKPFTVGFSLTDSGKRMDSAAIDQFYNEQILTRIGAK